MVFPLATGKDEPANGETNVNLQKLERMVAIYEAGSFRKAAKELGVALPTLTWSIQQLEESLNARLFERGPRGIRPTDLCERLVRRARLMIREQERIFDEVESANRAQVINVGVHSIFLSDEFAECLAKFGEQWSTVTVSVREGFSADLIERLLGGELDFVCCALPADIDAGGSLRVEPQARLTYSVVAPPSHPIFAEIERGEPIGNHNWVEFDIAKMGTFPSDDDIQAVLDTIGFWTARRSVRTTSMNLIRSLVLSGHHLGLIADECVARELADGTLKRVPNTQIDATGFGIISLKDDLDTKAVSALKALLVEKAFDPLKRLDSLI